MSFDHLLWSSTGSAESPMIFVLRRSNSLFIFAMVPSSVVHTGVKSLGCENSTAHLSPIHSWKRILPSVVSASKSGAISLMAKVMSYLRRLPVGSGNIVSCNIDASVRHDSEHL